MEQMQSAIDVQCNEQCHTNGSFEFVLGVSGQDQIYVVSLSDSWSICRASIRIQKAEVCIGTTQRAQSAKSAICQDPLYSTRRETCVALITIYGYEDIYSSVLPCHICSIIIVQGI
jgi:hypothetical protein